MLRAGRRGWCSGEAVGGQGRHRWHVHGQVAACAACRRAAVANSRETCWHRRQRRAETDGGGGGAAAACSSLAGAPRALPVVLLVTGGAAVPAGGGWPSQSCGRRKLELWMRGTAGRRGGAAVAGRRGSREAKQQCGRPEGGHPKRRAERSTIRPSRQRGGSRAVSPTACTQRRDQVQHSQDHATLLRLLHTADSPTLSEWLQRPDDTSA